LRILKSEVCYWPNRGYGDFGCEVTMDRAPWFENDSVFDQSCVKLADTDGSGTTDIVYLAVDGIRIYLNELAMDGPTPVFFRSLPLPTHRRLFELSIFWAAARRVCCGVPRYRAIPHNRSVTVVKQRHSPERPLPCRSGAKYKKCCGGSAAAAVNQAA